MLVGMIRPSRGDGTVLGKRIANAEENRQLRHKVAYVAESKPLCGYMTVQQTLCFASSFYADCLALRSRLPKTTFVSAASRNSNQRL